METPKDPNLKQSQYLEKLEDLLTQFKNAGINTVYDISHNPVQRSTSEVLEEVTQARKSEY